MTEMPSFASPIFLPPKVDFVFKRLFGGEGGAIHLVRFLQAALGLADEELTDLTLVDTHINREFEEDKQCILSCRRRSRRNSRRCKKGGRKWPKS